MKEYMGDVKLMPCKKCGYLYGRRIKYGHAFSSKTTYRITCPSCSYCTKEKDTLREAIDVWNSRNIQNEI